MLAEMLDGAKSTVCSAIAGPPSSEPVSEPVREPEGLDAVRAAEPRSRCSSSAGPFGFLPWTCEEAHRLAIARLLVSELPPRW